MDRCWICGCACRRRPMVVGGFRPMQGRKKVSATTSIQTLSALTTLSSDQSVTEAISGSSGPLCVSTVPAAMVDSQDAGGVVRSFKMLHAFQPLRQRPNQQDPRSPSKFRNTPERPRPPAKSRSGSHEYLAEVCVAFNVVRLVVCCCQLIRFSLSEGQSLSATLPPPRGQDSRWFGGV